MLVLCGRQRGLVCSITRLVHFGPLPEALRAKSEAVAAIDAAMMAATRPGVTTAQVFAATQAAYARAGYPDEYRLHHQGGPAGYEPRELIANPSTDFLVAAGSGLRLEPIHNRLQIRRHHPGRRAGLRNPDRASLDGP